MSISGPWGGQTLMDDLLVSLLGALRENDSGGRSAAKPHTVKVTARD